MRPSIEVKGFEAITAETTAEIASRAKTGIEVSGEGLKRELRAHTQAALGARLSKTWRLNFYGMRGSGESPAAFLYSKAPAIVKGHVEGATIVPVKGSKFLAIPTDHVPRRRGRGAKSRMSPQEVEQHYGRKMVARRGKRPGSILLFIVRGQGRRERLVHMFTLRRSVRLPKRIPAEASFEKWGRRLGRFLETGA